jgi:undecaprenyl-diphosphatase
MSEYWLNAAVKGLIEGITEFLPISSTAHLVLVDQSLPLTSDVASQEALNNMFDIVIQFPAVLAIFILFRVRLIHSLKGLSTRPEARNFWIALLIAFIPAGVLAVLLKSSIETHFRTHTVIAVALIVGGVVLMCVEGFVKRESVERAESTSLLRALWIGLFQCMALVPGVSRSGATIVGGRLFGLSRAAAAEFSFFLALPTMGAAFVYKSYKDFGTISWGEHWPVMLIGSVMSFLTAWAVVALFLRLINWKYSLTIWGIYRIILGSILLLV